MSKMMGGQAHAVHTSSSPKHDMKEYVQDKRGMKAEMSNGVNNENNLKEMEILDKLNQKQYRHGAKNQPPVSRQTN